MFEELVSRGFQVRMESHAGAILQADFPEAASEVTTILLAVDVPITEVIGSGGGETKGTQRMRRAFAESFWMKKNFEIVKIVDGVPKESTSHEVDHVKTFPNGRIALEIEWNNKDPFFDRDLENFKRLHNEGAISLGIIVTRSVALHNRIEEYVQKFADEQGIASFDDLERLNIYPTRVQRTAIERWTKRKREPMAFGVAWRKKFMSDKYGASHTNWRKLEDRIQRGVGNPCPLLLIGLPESILSFPATSSVAEDIEKASLDNADDSESEG